MAPGKAARARFSPSALLRAYCAVEFSSAPIADIWMNTRALAARAALAEASAPKACTASKLWAPAE